MSNSDELRKPEPSSTAGQPVEPTLDSPMKPLLWVLIPFILVLVYGILGSN